MLGLLKVFDAKVVLLHFFITESSSEMCMCIFWIFLNHSSKILYSLLMIFNHLISFGSLVDIPYIWGNHFNCLRKWINSFLEFFLNTVRQANVIIYIWFIRWKRLILQSFFECIHTIFRLFIGKIWEAQFIQNLWIGLRYI